MVIWLSFVNSSSSVYLILLYVIVDTVIDRYEPKLQDFGIQKQKRLKTHFQACFGTIEKKRVRERNRTSFYLSILQFYIPISFLLVVHILKIFTSLLRKVAWICIESFPTVFFNSVILFNKLHCWKALLEKIQYKFMQPFLGEVKRRKIFKKKQLLMQANIVTNTI